ncbi:chromate efflux transporter [Candidatus Poribacteria bacterium]|nr:chromate efflux transporter [Candidatus Poribacteria bacterium]
MMDRIGQLLGLFLKLGVTAFGGPAAHIAMMEDEVVTRRGWMTRERFLDLIGATNLIPGPNSTEMAIHIGFVRAGIVGLVVAGVSFILPAALLTLGCAWVYDRFQTVPQAEALLYGIKPAVIAVILSAVWRLGKTAAKGPFLIGIGFLVMVLVLFGINEIIALLGGGIVGVLWQLGSRLGKGEMLLGFVWLPSSNLALSVTAAPSSSVTLSSLGLFFLKIGCVLFGSGYVLIAFLQGGLVEQYQWLTQQQLLDAVAIGQFTPGPVLTTATFIGYVLAGPLGALVATLGIFGPSFLFVLATNPLIPRLRQSAVAGAFLDAVNASAIGLMAAVTVELARHTLIDWEAKQIDWGAGLIALVSAVVLFRYKVNSAWLVLGGAAIGWLLKTVT